ncbi:MAG: integral rane protein [Marmoricola sp.]|nr:integral rane protein [Marmoricola sp.]
MIGTWSLTRVPAGSPLDPSPDRARSLLRHELVHPAYHDQDLVRQILDWLGRRVDSTLNVASGAHPLSTVAAFTVFAILLVVLVWVLSRFRRNARTAARSQVVLTQEVVTAAELRRRAEGALAQGRPADAVIDGFRALTVRQIERGRLDDLPGATAREVATGLGVTFPAYGGEVRRSADLFDLVLYGDRPASDDQARAVFGLDDELARTR